MIGKQLVHYRITEKLGEGGMGAVFRAHDGRLRRDVAIKILKSDDPATSDRILREARTASRLNHPGICTLHDVGSAGDIDFLVMELVEGRTLGQLIDENPLDQEQVYDWALQLAEALGEAHRAGIGHGDLKPANVMVTESGRIKILDFGVARVVRARDTEETQTMGEPSMGGTVAFMAPERLRGGRADARSDIFALGEIVYAMLTGRNPFVGTTPAVVIDAILHQAPTPIQEQRHEVAEGFVRVVQRCLAKNPADRYGSADDLIGDLQAARSGAAIPEVEARSPSLAVLLFENLGGKPDDKYFCDGVTEDIITELSRIEELRVFPRSSVAAFKGADTEPVEVGRHLGATHIVEGSIRRDGKRLRVTARLIQTSSRHTVWSDRFDRTLDDVFAIQDEIARRIAQSLEVALTEHEERDSARIATFSVSAYDYYLRGRHEFDRSGIFANNDSLEYGIAMYRKAIELDPNYAQAWAGVAEYRAIQHIWFGAGPETLEEAEKASLRAMELDAELPEVLIARAVAVDSAEQIRALFDRVLARWPSHFDTCYLRGRFEYGAGCFEDAARFFSLGMDARPDDVQCSKLLTLTLEGLGRKEEALQIAEETLRRVDKRLTVDRDNPILLATKAYMLAFLGREQEALAYLERVVELASQMPSVQFNAACLLAKLGQNERAITTLVAVLETGFGRKDWLRHDSDLATIRSDPRISKFLERHG